MKISISYIRNRVFHMLLEIRMLYFLKRTGLPLVNAEAAWCGGTTGCRCWHSVLALTGAPGEKAAPRNTRHLAHAAGGRAEESKVFLIPA